MKYNNIPVIFDPLWLTTPRYIAALGVIIARDKTQFCEYLERQMYLHGKQELIGDNLIKDLMVIYAKRKKNA